MNVSYRPYFFLIFWMVTCTALAQSPEAEKEAAYTRVLSERSSKIVTTLGLTDSTVIKDVKSIISQQYRAINTTHAEYKSQQKALKETLQNDKEKLDSELKNLEAKLGVTLDKMRAAYLTQLSKKLSAKQIDQVKDGMTYGVLPITYKGYQEMLPNLTDAQKTQILAYLTEARDHAMDAESSEKKHAWFGKYKGKINNYLSAAGIDMKKAGLEWEQRIKAAQAEKQH